MRKTLERAASSEEPLDITGRIRGRLILHFDLLQGERTLLAYLIRPRLLVVIEQVRVVVVAVADVDGAH